MRYKRLLILVIAFVLISAVSVLANDTYQSFRGNNVKVYVNDSQLDKPGILVSNHSELRGTTMLPLREISETLQAIVQWNGRTQTVNIYKPNVHISLIEEVEERRRVVHRIFGQVTHQLNVDFAIFIEIDNITTPVHSVKVEMLNPNGKMVHEEVVETLLDKREELWVTSRVSDFDFLEVGGYKIKVYMKINADDDYSLVSERMLQSLPNN